jgi:hypothetical protein
VSVPLYGRNGLITRRGGLEPRTPSAMERILQAPQRLATNPWGVALIQQDHVLLGEVPTEPIQALPHGLIVPEPFAPYDGVIYGYGVRGKGYLLTRETVGDHLWFGAQDALEGKLAGLAHGHTFWVVIFRMKGLVIARYQSALAAASALTTMRASALVLQVRLQRLPGQRTCQTVVVLGVAFITWSPKGQGQIQWLRPSIG